MHQRKNLLFCPVKNGVAVPQILGDQRTFDVATNDYAGAPNSTEAEFSFNLQKHKWPTIRDVLPLIGLGYDYYGFIDDDLIASTETLNGVFEYARQHDLSLFQPALTAESGGWYKCVFQRGVNHHETNFIEIMCPFFSKSFLRKAIPLIGRYTEKYESGWGLDALWSQLAIQIGVKPTVIDRWPLTHPGGPTSELWIMSNGKRPGNEYVECLRDPYLAISSFI